MSTFDKAGGLKGAFQTRSDVLAVYHDLLAMYGEQAWWPADSPFEVMIGAILTQNTAWSNVEPAIAQLKSGNCLTPERIAETAPEILEAWLKPTGYYRQKAQRLREYCQWYLAQGGLAALRRLSAPKLRAALLGVRGIGPETADDILLYAFERPIFVIDAYTRRLAGRLGWMTAQESYPHMQQWFMSHLPQEVPLYNQYHALIVAHAKQRCRKRQPLCEGCMLQSRCHHPFTRETASTTA